MRRLGGFALWAATALGEAVLAQAWVAALIAAFGPLDWRAAVPPLPLLLAVFAAGAIITGRWGPEERAPQWRQWLHTAIGAVLIAGAYAWMFFAWSRTWTGLVGGNPVLTTLVAAWYLWIQGAQAGGKGLAFSGMAARFPVRGTAMVACAFAGAWFVRAGYAPEHLWPILYRSVLAFFGTGLTALALARLWQVRAWQVAVGEQDEPERISPGLVALVLAVVAVSVGVESLGPGGVLESVGQALLAVALAVGGWLEPVAEAFLAPLLKLMGLFVVWFRSLRTLDLRAEDGERLEDVPSKLDPGEMVQVNLDAWARAAIVLAVLAALAVMLLVMKSARRWSSARRPDLTGDEQRESLGVLKNLWGDIKGLWTLLQAWLQGLVRRGGRLVGLGRPAAADAEWLAAAPPVRDVRAAFRRLQQIGQRHGRPRRPAETPARYGVAMGRLLPAGAGAAQALAQLYSRVRYGCLEPGAAEVAAARQAVAEVEAAAGGGPPPLPHKR